MTESEPRPNPTEREQTPGANALAQHLQDTFLGRNNELTPDQIRDSGIYLDNTRENTTQRLVAPNGIVDGKRAYQTLGYSPKNNKWYFTTVFKDPGSRVIHHRIAPGNDKSPIIVAALNDSIFAQKIREATGKTN